MAQILVIEDDDAVRCVISAALTAAGHTVLEASDGRAGLRVFGANKIDLVVTDILMPDLNGVEFVDDTGLRGFREDHCHQRRWRRAESRRFVNRGDKDRRGCSAPEAISDDRSVRRCQRGHGAAK